MTSENIQALKEKIKNSEIKELKELDIKYLSKSWFCETQYSFMFWGRKFIKNG